MTIDEFIQLKPYSLTRMEKAAAYTVWTAIKSLRDSGEGRFFGGDGADAAGVGF